MAVRKTIDLPPIRVPPGLLYGSPSPFVNVHKPGLSRTILLEEILPESAAELDVIDGTTPSYLSQLRGRHAPAGIRTRLRFLSDKLRHGSGLSVGSGYVYDARKEFNGNLAHLLQMHVATLGLMSEQLGIQPGQCRIILENHAPAIAVKLFAFLGYETIQTHLPVRGKMLVQLQYPEAVPYAFISRAALVAPASVPKSELSRIYISRRSRGIRNSTDIDSVAAEHGYTKIYMEDFSLPEQIGLMRHATSILAIHGAALGHLCLRSPAFGCPPIELFEILSPALVSDIFRKYVAALGGFWQGCRGTIDAGFQQLKPGFRHLDHATYRDFAVDPGALEACLSERIGLTIPGKV